MTKKTGASRLNQLRLWRYGCCNEILLYGIYHTRHLKIPMLKQSRWQVKPVMALNGAMAGA